ncbi:MAG TPA: energy-coupling factor transporter transmembrane protein EcfT [Syntrophomonadaceae bacterium]|nr:energy-coupling factor transporter transmembrane protein EcfT [Syntrophomonadaceae bacterium]
MYNLGTYVHRGSPVHRLDPRVKILAAVAFSIIILHVDAVGLLAAAGLILVITGLGRIPIKTLLSALKPGLPFFFLLFLMNIFFTPGKLLLDLGFIQISHQGLQLGLLQIWRFILLIIIAAILTMTTLPAEITMGLERLLRPIGIFRISSHDIAMMICLALRFIPVLLQEMNSIKEAQSARGANFSRGSMRSAMCLIEPLTVNIFKRCDDLVDAMEARGYQQGNRTYLRELVLSWTDYCLIGGMVVVVIAILIW